MRYYTRDASVSSNVIAYVFRVSDGGRWEVWHARDKKWQVLDDDTADNRQREIAFGDMLMTRVPEAVGLTWAARLSGGEPPPDP